MATRYYPGPKCPRTIYHGIPEGDWALQGAYNGTISPVQFTWELTQTKADLGNVSASNFACNQSPNYDFLVFRWVTPPLDAQALTGTFDVCFFLQNYYATISTVTNSAVVKLKFHSYIAVGQTTTVRTVLIDNNIGPTFPYIDDPGSWLSFAAPIAVSGAISAGDVIVHELGIRFQSMPTPAPTYPPSDLTRCQCVFLSGDNFADAVPADTSQDKASWMEYSDTLTEQAQPAAPANDACADAIVITDEYYVSPWIVTTQSADTDRSVWWKGTPTRSGVLFVTTVGSNYGITIDCWTGACGALDPVPEITTSNLFTVHRSQAVSAINVVSGTEYFIQVSNRTNTFNAPDSGGVCRLLVFFQETPEEDDLYLPNGNIQVLREGLFVGLSPDFYSSEPTGIALDYTLRPMEMLASGTNTSVRILIGLHSTDLVEIIDCPTLSLGGPEIDWIGNPWNESVTQHPAQLVVTQAGMLHSGWFGNGYLFVAGVGTGLPAVLNDVSDVATYSALKSIDATHGDNQSGAPYTDTVNVIGIESYAGWAIAYSEASGILYYTSGGFYIPTGEVAETIKRWDVTNSIQLADFATVTLNTDTRNPGLKGIQLLNDGGLLVCNGAVVNRLNSAGNIIMTYTPSIALDATQLTDVKITTDGASFWVIDAPSTRLYKFGLDSGTEITTFQPYGLPDTLVQMAIYQPEGVPTTDNTFSGVYKIVPGKRQDTLWEDLTTRETRDVKIPDPFVKTAYLGE